MASVVFDASAILALLGNEPGAEIVARHIGDGIISAVNFQEVVKELLRRGIPIGVALELLDALHLRRRGSMAADWGIVRAWPSPSPRRCPRSRRTGPGAMSRRLGFRCCSSDDGRRHHRVLCGSSRHLI